MTSGYTSRTVRVESDARARVHELAQEDGLLRVLHDELAVRTAAAGGELTALDGQEKSRGGIAEPHHGPHGVRLRGDHDLETGGHAQSSMSVDTAGAADADGLGCLLADNEDDLSLAQMLRPQCEPFDVGRQDKFRHVCCVAGWL